MKGQTASGLVLILLGFALVVRTLRGQTTKRIRDLIGSGNDFTTPQTGRENTTPGQPNTGPGGGGNFGARVRAA